MPGGNLPPGCEVSDIPGNRPEDGKWEAIIEGFWSKKGRSKEQQEALDNAPQEYVDLIDEAIEYGVECGRIDQQETDAENHYYKEQAKEYQKGKEIKSMNACTSCSRIHNPDMSCSQRVANAYMMQPQALENLTDADKKWMAEHPDFSILDIVEGAIAEEM